MKRAIPQEPTPEPQLSPNSDSDSARQGFSGNHRRVRTSAAMLGLALSMGASGTLLCQTEGAVAADQVAEPMLLAAALPADSLSVDKAAPVASYHTIQEGETLWQIAKAHQVDVPALKAANGIVSDEDLKVGQVIRIPAAVDVADVSSTDLSVSAEPKSQSVASKADALAVSLETASATEHDWSETQVSAQPLISAALPEATEKSVGSRELASTPSSLPEAKSSGSELGTVGSPTWVSRSVESSESAFPAEASVAPAVEPSAPTASVPSVAPSVLKKPQQLAALSERLNEAGVATSSSNAIAPGSEVYRVKPGDTLSTIAARFGLKPSALAEANRVDNPNLIVVGDTLQIPAESLGAVAEGAGSDLALASNADHNVSKSAHLARLREAVSNPVDRDELYARIRQARQSLEEQNSADKAEAPASDSARLASLPDSLPLNSNSEAVSQRNPHVANLIAEIRSMQRQQTTAIAPNSTEEATQIAAITALRNNSSASTEAAPVNPELFPAVGGSRSSGPAPELLAAAPLSPEAYSPANVPVGRTVSPDMPILPGATEYLPEAPNRFDGYIWPAQGVLTSGFGPRWGRMHKGIDIAAPVGTPIYAAASGVVERAGWNSGGYGNLVDIRHPDGSLTRYGHNSRLLVRAGQEVRQGQQIAEMGSTGYSTGPHCHFEVHPPGSDAVNPIAYLPRR